MLSLAIMSLGATAMAGTIGKMTWDFFRKEEEIEVTLEEKLLFEERLNKFFKNTKLINEDLEAPGLIDYRITDNTIEFKIALVDGVSLTDLKKEEEDFLVYFKASSIKMNYTDDRSVDITIYKNRLKDQYDFKFTKLLNPTEILLGIDVNNQTIVKSIHNAFIGGQTRSGKTSYLQQMILNAVLNFKDSLELEVIDLKSTDLIFYKDLKQCKSFSSTNKDALEVLQRLEKEMLERFELLKKHNVSNIADLNQKFKNRLKYKYIIIDEIANLNNDKVGKEAYKVLDNIASKCVSAGMHVIASCQRNDSNVMPSTLKNNFTQVIGFKVANKFTSEVICNLDILKDLRGNGHGIYFGDGQVEFQAMFISTEDLQKEIKKLNNA